MGFGIGIVIGTGIFTLTGVEAKNHAGPAIVLSFAIAGDRQHAGGPLLRRARRRGADRRQLLHLRLHDHRRDLRLDHRLGPDPGVRPRRRRRLARLVGLPAGARSTCPRRSSARRTRSSTSAPSSSRSCSAPSPRSGSASPSWSPTPSCVIKVSVCVFVIVVGALLHQGRQPGAVDPAEPAGRRGVAGLKQPLWQWVSGVDPASFGVAGVFVAAGVVFFAYSGFEAVANLGEETKDPAKDMPRGLIGTLVICTVLYLGVCFVLTGMVNYGDLSEGAPISDAFDQVGLGWAVGADQHRGDRRSQLGDPGRHRRDGPDRLRAVPRRAAARRRSARCTSASTRRSGSPSATTAVVCLLGGLRPARRRWPRWSASARCSRSSWWRSRSSCCGVPSRR